MSSEVPEVIASVGDDSKKQYFVDGEFNPEYLTQALKQQEGLADTPDDLGNIQSHVRLDNDPDGREGYWVTVPSNIEQSTIDAAVSAYDDVARAAEEEAMQGMVATTTIGQLKDLPDGQVTKADLLKAFGVESA